MEGLRYVTCYSSVTLSSPVLDISHYSFMVHLINLRTQWSRVFFQKLMVAQLVYNFSALYEV
jgi:hypothetical protein